jgi:rSAM/selenodomain-associated transferase 1
MANEYPDEDLWSDVYYTRQPQKGPDLGERMAHAFAWAFVHGYEEVIIIGSDCAELKYELLNEAFEKLKQYDAVIGPAKDGGYYLLGLKEVFAPVFINKQWSTDTVFAETLQDLEEAGKSVYQLPVLSDIDTMADIPGTFLEKHLP